MKSLQDTYAPQNRCFGCGPSNEKGLQIKSFADGRYEVTRFLGDGVLMYASDYPHMECRFPNSTDYFLNWSLDDDLKRKMLWENPVRFYGQP